MSSIDILAPILPESVSYATVAIWNKNIGDKIIRDEILLEIETDKIMLEVPAVADGILETILKNVGAKITSGELLGKLKECIQEEIIKKEPIDIRLNNESRSLPINPIKNYFSPSTRRFITKHGINVNQIKDNINDQIILKNQQNNLLNQLEIPNPVVIKEKISDSRDQRVPMNSLRKRIAERLLEVTHNTAMLTTFNEVNMQPIINIRKKYGESFEKYHGIRLGFMSFYIKAVVEALKKFPKINACIDGEDIVYHNYFDISIAVSTKRGLVTPVLKNADSLSLAEIEKNIKILAEKSRSNKLSIKDLTGGNFTITNGGVFGSLISTPIINPPQSAILGMHAIKERPVAINGQIVILPMMYLALSYDHRLIDGQEAISFLLKVKEIIEDTTRILLDI